LLLLGLLLILLAIPSQCPNWENVAVLGISDATAAIEHPCDPFLVPIPIRLLLADEVTDTGIDGRWRGKGGRGGRGGGNESVMEKFGSSR